MRIIHLLFVFILTISACVERLDAPVIVSDRTLVVDGAVTNQPGSYSVKLFYSSNLNEPIKTPQPVEGALVWITENNITKYTLAEAKPGVYETDAFVGIVGNTYNVSFETEDGKMYESTSEVLTHPGNLDRVFAEFEENSINPNDLSEPQDAFYIYIDGTGDERGRNLLRWRWEATYQVRTNPPGGPTDPPSCSCNCCDCWVTFYNKTVALSDPSITSGNSFNRIIVGIIPVKNTYFYDRLLVRVNQLSMSEDVYTFWNLVKAQQDGAVNIFQPQVVKVKGNIFSITNPEEEVFGIFSVSGIAENKIELTLQDIPKQIPSYRVINADCRYTGGTNVRPLFY